MSQIELVSEVVDDIAAVVDLFFKIGSVVLGGDDVGWAMCKNSLFGEGIGGSAPQVVEGRCRDKEGLGKSVLQCANFEGSVS